MEWALVETAKLLFLDEPTGAMDNQTENLFIDHLEKALEPDQTLIVSTHSHALLRIVDRLLVIAQGLVLADGPRDEIIGQLQRWRWDERRGGKECVRPWHSGGTQCNLKNNT